MQQCFELVQAQLVETKENKQCAAPLCRVEFVTFARERITRPHEARHHHQLNLVDRVLILICSKKTVETQALDVEHAGNPILMNSSPLSLCRPRGRLACKNDGLAVWWADQAFERE